MLYDSKMIDHDKQSIMWPFPTHIYRIFNSDFTVHFGEIFSLRIVEWPESLKLQVYEAGLLSSTLLSEVFVPLPEPQQTCQAPPTSESYQFTSSKVASFTHAAVGSGQL